MNSVTISRNSFWYGLDMGFSLIAGTFTSIAVARVIGPEKLGNLFFIVMLSDLASSIGSLGIPGTVRKYMAEYLGRGEFGIARSIFFQALKIQSCLSVGIATLALLLYFFLGERQFFPVAVIMISSIVPNMIGAIAAQANVASENMMANVPGALASTAIYATVALLTLRFGWGLPGLAASMLISRIAEFGVRMAPTVRKVNQWKSVPLPESLRLRMFSFSKNSVILLLLSLIVWDRSEVYFLKYFWADPKQIAFYSVAFSITEKLLLGSQVFGGATASSLMAQFGRDERAIGPMVATALRYHTLMAIPIHIGVAVLSAPLILTLYGQRYAPAIPLLSIAALFGIAKALMPPLNNGLAAKDRQPLVVKWMLVVAALNLALDGLLIPRNGAWGAVIANGSAQTFASVGLLVIAHRVLNFPVPVKQLARIGVSGIVMGIFVAGLRLKGMGGPLLLIIAPVLGGLTFFLLLRLTASLNASDRTRLQAVFQGFPGMVRKAAQFGIGFLVPAVSEEAR